jgi:putative RecB family exonuclease
VDLDHPPVDWARLVYVKNMHRSVSQAEKYLPELGGCAYRYFLSYVVQAWDRPAAWLPQGIAVHQAAEWWEKGGRKGSRDEMRAVYKRAYNDATEKALAGTPNTDFWFASGRYEGAEDIKRRAAIGLGQVDKYYDYYVFEKPNEVIWVTPDGSPAIELEFRENFGSVSVLGYIDQVVNDIMRDIKTGIKPGGLFQLSTYRYAVLSKYGVDFIKGDFWMARQGGPTKPLDLTLMPKDQIVDYYERTDEGIKAEDFEPSPSPEACGRCGVATACKYAM